MLDLVSDWLADLSLNTGMHLHVMPLPYEAAAPHAQASGRWEHPSVARMPLSHTLGMSTPFSVTIV